MKNRVGEINYNKYRNIMTIIKYTDANNIVVKFEDGYVTNSAYREFKNGSISNPYDKTVYGVGYLGEGKYKAKTNCKHSIQYFYWHEMLKRCYDEKYLEKEPTYIGCSVDEEWHNFQNFGKWFDENYYEINDERMQIDKDILVKGNKTYNSETCIFVPQRINSLFIKQERHRGDYPIGINLLPSGKFRARCSVLEINKMKHIGVFNSPEKAFYKGYKPFKENYIKEIADKYKELIPQKLYEALYKYEVWIYD